MADPIARLGRLLAERQGRLYCDIAPLIEPQWTGIPVVAAGLAGVLAARLPQQARFFLDLDIVATAAVQDALRRGHGLFLKRDINTGAALAGTLPLLAPPGPSIGLYPNYKRVRRLFTIECSLFHDLSTLVVPQFHTRQTVEHHMAAMADDIASNDLTVAVSQASADDLAAYLGLRPREIAVAPNGVGWPGWYAAAAENDCAAGEVEPYFLILGTREPRKNVLMVFDLLLHAPQLLRTHRFVFAGRMGWLEEQHALPAALEPAVNSGRILFTGFVGDYEKYKLLRGAEATLYPSLFEGFGLPVLESLSVGTPCVASFSSSIPEVGGDLCCYFDPFSPADFLAAIERLLALRQARGAALAEACRARAAGFTWESALGAICERLLPRLREVAAPEPS